MYNIYVSTKAAGTEEALRGQEGQVMDRDAMVTHLADEHEWFAQFWQTPEELEEEHTFQHADGQVAHSH
jgi:hypothetical protein